MLSNFFRKKKAKEPPSGAPLLAPGTTQTILNVIGARSIPSMPGAAQKAFKIATDPKAEARDFVEVFESDEALSARVLKIANSVFFDRGHQTSTIEDAVTVIGLNELRSLLSATSLSEIFPSKHPTRATLWSHDIAVALTARALARRSCPQKQDLAFLGGLMHDVGKLLLLQRCPEEYQRALRLVEHEGLDFVKAEEHRFPFTHTEVGQLIGEQWHFSPELVAIIRRHHDDWSALSQPGLELVALIKAADTLAHALGLGHSVSMAKLKAKHEERLPDVWAALGIPEPDRVEMLDSLKKTFTLEHDQLSAGLTQAAP
ncbi:MAG: HDOD domain-containing protein [Oligoflexia bacterium]|nr:HDOD domain-containing protein [Oligoflexia bacterium]